jgi:hypothetical protein
MPRVLSSALQALIADSVIRPAILVELLFDSGPVRANSTPIDITIGGYKYLGVGTLGKIGAVEESTETQAHQLMIELSGIPRELVALALSEKYQGRRCNLFVAYLDQDWRVPDGAWVQLFGGRINTMRIEMGDMARIHLTAESRFVEWEKPRGGRYTDEEQQARWPGDLGLQFVARTVEQELVWGAAPPAPAAGPVMVQGGGGGKK